jgi:hypothetical protein
MSNYTNTYTGNKNEILIRQNVVYLGTFNRNVPWRHLSNSLGLLSKQQRHYRCRTVGKLYPTIQFSKGILSMKKLLKVFYEISLSIGQARAAAAMARAGMHKEARDIMLAK